MRSRGRFADSARRAPRYRHGLDGGAELVGADPRTPVAEALAGAALGGVPDRDRTQDGREIGELHPRRQAFGETVAAHRPPDVHVITRLRAADDADLGGVRAGAAVRATGDV